MVAVASTVGSVVFVSGTKAMNCRCGPACEFRLAPKSSPAVGSNTGFTVYAPDENWHWSRVRVMSPVHGWPGLGLNDARNTSPAVVGVLGSSKAPCVTGENAGVVRVVACDAIWAKMADSAFWRSPGVSAKYASVGVLL